MVTIDGEVYPAPLPRLGGRSCSAVSGRRYKRLLKDTRNGSWREGGRGLAIENKSITAVQFRARVKGKELRVMEEVFAINREK